MRFTTWPDRGHTFLLNPSGYPATAPDSLDLAGDAVIQSDDPALFWARPRR